MRGPAVVERYLGQTSRPPTRKDGSTPAILPHRRQGQPRHHRPRQGSHQVRRRMDQSGADRGDRRRAASGLACRRRRAHRPEMGERPILLVEMRKGQDLTDEELLAPLDGRVASWWIPDEVVRVPKMPTAATGKVDKLRCARNTVRRDISASPVSGRRFDPAQRRYGGLHEGSRHRQHCPHGHRQGLSRRASTQRSRRRSPAMSSIMRSGARESRRARSRTSCWARCSAPARRA